MLSNSEKKYEAVANAAAFFIVCSCAYGKINVKFTETVWIRHYIYFVIRKR